MENSVYHWIFFIYAVFIGIYCSHNMYAMDIEYKKDVAINMQSLWSEEYNRNISAIKDVNLKDMRSHLKQDNYLSPQVKTLDHLLYLSTIGKDNAVKTLFTQKQQNKFDTAACIKRSVPWVFFFNGVVIGVTALFPFTSFSALSQCSNANQSECLSQTSTIMTPTVISVVGSLTVGFVSLYATGLSPDLSSRMANKVQDEIGHLSRTYATIAKYLIDIYFEEPGKAEWIANKFDITELKLRAQQKTYKAKLGSSLVSPLEEALYYIKTKTILITFTDIENYIYNKMNSRRIEELSRANERFANRIEDLESRLGLVQKSELFDK